MTAFDQPGRMTMTKEATKITDEEWTSQLDEAIHALCENFYRSGPEAKQRMLQKIRDVSENQLTHRPISGPSSRHL